MPELTKKIPVSLKECCKGVAYPSLYVLLVVLFLSIWHIQVTQHFSPKAFAFYSILAGVSLVYGRIFLKLFPSLFTNHAGLTVQFLCGYFALNTLGFEMSFITKFTMTGNILFLCGCGIVSAVLFRPKREASKNEQPDYLPEILCLLLSGCAATLWCVDALNPIVINDHFITFQTWTDSFFHAREIGIFSKAHGLGTISDVQMSGAPATIYHYASYVIPAAMASFTHTGAYEIFESFYLPFGILLTGLAAFCLTSSIWGAWPGIAGTAALILLPDAYQQGFQNKIMSYNFLQQANPGGLYGVALIAMAWMFLLDGCKTGKITSLFLGYAIGIISVSYKAQLFVANAFLIMIYPCIFFKGLKAKRRFIAGILLVALFICIVNLSQHSSAIPTLRLDGSGSKHYARTLLASYDKAAFRYFFYHELTGLNPVLFDMSMACMVMISSFGLWIVALTLFFNLQGKDTHVAARWFPIFVIVNYLIMSVGLAVDEKKIGMPEELLHRPVVWAYFAVVAWTGAAGFAFLAGKAVFKHTYVRILCGLLLFFGLLIPTFLAHNIQTMPSWPGYGHYELFNSYPKGLVKASLYIGKHSNADDIVQDSENDSRLVLTALAERQDFATYNDSGLQLRTPEGLPERVKDLEGFKKMTDEQDVIKFATKNHISWYLLEPNSGAAWPEELIEKSVFNSGGYRVYHFPL